MRKLIALIERAVVVPDDRRSTRNRKVFNVLATCAFVPLLATFVGPLLISSGAPLAGWIYVATGSALFLNLLIFALTHKNNTVFAATSLPIVGVGVTGACLAMGGLAASAGGYIWLLVGFVAFPTSNFPRWAELTGCAACVAAVILVAALEPYLPQVPLSPKIARVLIVTSYLTTCMHLFAVVYFTVDQNRLAFRLMRNERAKADGLLLNILPREVAAILKEQSRTIAEEFGQASVLFADVVGFTPMTSRMTPPELVDLLNEVFSCFDALVDEYGLEKIKTIGDCYMVASGVPRPRQDHAHVLVQMALAMRKTLGDRDFAGRRLLFRIGINSGPVVAGVIGKKKFAYDLWGDAVNTASRMESHGEAGQIQITQSTFELVCDRFICEPKGTIEVKGKGTMSVWHVVGPKGAAEPAPGPAREAQPLSFS